MRDPTRGAGTFGAIAVSLIALLILASLASGQVYQDSRVSPRDEVIDSAATEAALRVDVARHLRESPSLAGSDLMVTSEGSTVVLHGTVVESADVGAAEAITRGVRGVTGVVNEIRVAPTRNAGTIPAVPDSDLALRVAQTLAEQFDEARVDRKWDSAYEVEIDDDGSPTDWEIEVHADGGLIMLGGILPSYEWIGRVVSVSRSVSGVQTVQSNLQLAGGADDDSRAPADESARVGRFPKPRFRPFWPDRSGQSD